jgi:hypothetical protein
MRLFILRVRLPAFQLKPLVVRSFSKCMENGEPSQCLKRILTAQFDPRFKCQSAEGSAPPCVKEPGKKNRDEHQRPKPDLPRQHTGQLNLSCPIQPLAFPHNPLLGGGHRGPPNQRTARTSAGMRAVEQWDAVYVEPVVRDGGGLHSDCP